MHTHTHMRTHARTYTRTYIYTHSSTQTHIHTYTHTPTQTHTQARSHARLLTHFRAHTHTHTHTITHTCTHTRTHEYQGQLISSCGVFSKTNYKTNYIGALEKTWLNIVHVWDTTHSCVTHSCETRHTHVRHSSCLHKLHQIPRKDMARSCRQHQTNNTGTSHSRQTSLPNMRHDSHIWDMTPLYETWLPYMRHYSPIWDMTPLYETWLLYMQHGSLIWDISMRDSLIDRLDEWKMMSLPLNPSLSFFLSWVVKSQLIT